MGTKERLRGSGGANRSARFAEGQEKRSIEANGLFSRTGTPARRSILQQCKGSEQASMRWREGKPRRSWHGPQAAPA